MENIYIAIVSSITTIILTFIKLKFDLKKNKAKKEEEQDDSNIKIHKIKNHIFFTMIISYKGDLYSKFSLKNKGKETVFRFILYYTIKSIESNFKILANKIDSQNIGDIDELKRLNIDAIEKSYRNIRELYSRPDITEDEQIALKIALNKFTIWNSSRFERLRTNIINITTSEFYDTPISMEAAILDVISHALYDIIEDGKSSFDTINGDLSGLVFKGIKI